MIFAYLLLTITFRCAFANSFVKENVVFEKVNEITTTRSRWLVAFVIDTDPYQKVLDRLSDSFQGIKNSLSEAWSEMSNLNGLARNRLNNVLSLLYKERQNIKRSRDFLRDELDEIHAMHRSKRSLIPIVGKALSFLFGTLSDSDVDSIRRNVVRLAAAQTKLTHVVEGSLTILKTTQGQTINNTRTINDLIDNLANLEIASQNLTEDVRDLQNYVQVYTQLDRATSDAQALIEIARDYSQNLKLQLNMLSLGHLSPSVIAPSELRKLLEDVKKQLSSQFKFPFDPEEDIWTFYKTLTCTTLMEGSRLVVVMSIPLLDNIGYFEVYRIHNMALPLNGSNQTNVSARFYLETTAIAVDKRRTQFTLLTDIELQSCSDPLKAYCTFMSPVYLIMATKMCVIQVFLGHQEGIAKFCRTVIQLNAPSPQARYITDGHWAITSAAPLTFSVLCNSTSSSSKVIKIRTPIDIVSLDLTCSAYNGHMTLLPFYQKRTRYNLTDQFRLFIQNYNFGLISVWKTFEIELPNFSDIQIPPKLKENKEIPVDRLIREIKNNPLDLEPMPASPPFWTYMLDAIGLGILLALIFIFRRRLQNCMSKFKIHKRSVRRGRREDSGRRTPNQGLTDVAPSAPSCEDVPVEDDPTNISRPSMMCRPNARLAAEYLSEKYSIRPNPSTSNSAEWRNILREDGCEYGTHPAGGFYFRKLEKPNSRPQTLNLETDGNEPRTHENAPPTTSGNPEHDVTVEADVIKTASSQTAQRRIDSMPKEAVHPGRMAGQMSIYPSLRQEAKQ